MHIWPCKKYACVQKNYKKGQCVFFFYKNGTRVQKIQYAFWVLDFGH